MTYFRTVVLGIAICGKCGHDKTLSDLYLYEAREHLIKEKLK